jgi:hypothetical protein
MNLHELLSPFTGAWTGSNRLWMRPGEEAEESESTATVSFSGQGKFAELRYTWSTEGDPEDGLILLRELRGGVQTVWGDSWHTPDGFYLWNGDIREGVVIVRGSYPAPAGPDWGWRIEIDARQTGLLRLEMFNITPEGEEMLAVQAVYSRK